MSYSSEVLADSPLAYWRLGEASGTTMTDSSGNGRDGTYTSADILTATSLLTGDSNTGINPQGIVGGLNNGHGTIASASWMDVTAITLECWIKLDGAQSNRGLLTRFNTGLDWLLWIDTSSKIAARFYNTSGSQVNIAWSTTPTTGVTYHVVATYQSGQARLYIDGTQVASSTALTGNLRAAANAINVGAYQDTNSTRFNGTIDEAAIYSGELSSTRIADHHTVGTGGTLSIAGSFAASVPVAAASFTGSYTPPDETGTFAVDVPVPVPAFTGSYQAPPTGSFAATLTVPVADFTGSYTAPADPTGSFAVDLPVPVVDFTGGYTPPPISGTMSVDLLVPVADFTGTVGGLVGSFAVSLPVPTVVFEGSYGGPYPTDTSNLFDGLNMVCIGTVTLARAAVVPPTAPPKSDKALPYPEPVMVDGRPT